MSQLKKTLILSAWVVLVLLLLAVIAPWQGLLRGWGDSPDPGSHSVALAVPAAAALPVFYPAPKFDLTDQDAKPFSSSGLDGEVWVAATMFTRCPSGMCPMITARMTELQAAITNPRVQLVSISLQPEKDTPAVLKQYAEKVNADLTRWHFLTGDKATILELVRKGLKLPVEEGPGEDNILHADRLVLVDQTGQIRGYYPAGDPESMTKLASDATMLAEGPAQ